MDELGKKAEELFYNLMKLKCKKVIKSTQYQNMFEHIDFICDGISYDVKAQKKFNRNDSQVSNIIWLEIKNVRGNIGWLKSNVDKIAFQYKEKFLIVDRLKLYNWLKSEIKDLTIYNYKNYKKLYRRYGRKDIITYIYYTDLIKLIEKVIK